MPNWCITDYIVEGPKDDLLKIKDAIEHHKVRDKSAENWEGNVLLALGVNPDNFKYMRGFINYLDEFNDLDKGILKFCAEEAWSVTDFGIALESLFPNVKVYWVAEEPGASYYCTNDKEGKHFKDRYYAECCIEGIYGMEYFQTEKAIESWLSDMTKGKITTVQEAEDFNETCAEDEYISIFEFQVCE